VRWRSGEPWARDVGLVIYDMMQAWTQAAAGAALALATTELEYRVELLNK
jgi:hypothetical protein